jgi:predicted transcriptional regulator
MTYQVLHQVADALTARRKALGLSRERLAAAAGVSGQTVARIEAGRVKPQPSTVAAILGALSAAEAETKSSPEEATSGSTNLPVQAGGRDPS